MLENITEEGVNDLVEISMRVISVECLHKWCFTSSGAGQRQHAHVFIVTQQRFAALGLATPMGTATARPR